MLSYKETQKNLHGYYTSSYSSWEAMRTTSASRHFEYSLTSAKNVMLFILRKNKICKQKKTFFLQKIVQPSLVHEQTLMIALCASYFFIYTNRNSCASEGIGVLFA